MPKKVQSFYMFSVDSLWSSSFGVCFFAESGIGVFCLVGFTSLSGVLPSPAKSGFMLFRDLASDSTFFFLLAYGSLSDISFNRSCRFRLL
jgi:hypothetical protein